MGLGQFDESLPVISGIQLTSTTPINTNQAVVASQTNRTRIDVLTIANTDTVAHNVLILLTAGATTLYIGKVQVAAGAGTGTVAPLDVLAQLFGSVYHYLTYPGSVVVNCQLGEALAAGTFLDIFAMGGFV